VPFIGQTTLPVFGVGGKPSYQNDQDMFKAGGSLLNKDIFGS
jgi:hypothetical protein